MKQVNDTLNIAALCSEGSKELGPGNRFVIWLQGCDFNCLNCESPDWREKIEANIVNIEKLTNLISESEHINGITISGGEPFLQVTGLIKFMKLIKTKRPELNTIVFTGYDFVQLNWLEAKEFLNYIDVIITGKYIDKLNDNKGLRGSTNQEIVFLTDKLKQFTDYFYNKQRNLEYHVRENEILMVGLRPKN